MNLKEKKRDSIYGRANAMLKAMQENVLYYKIFSLVYNSFKNLLFINSEFITVGLIAIINQRNIPQKNNELIIHSLKKLFLLRL